MTTGLAWNISNPLKPWALFDPSAVRDIPFEWDLWLADIGSTYASHTIITDPLLQCTVSAQAAGIIKARISVIVPASVIVGTKYTVTCRITAANGEVEDQTLYLKMFNK
jgi:hypothetical protein